MFRWFLLLDGRTPFEVHWDVHFLGNSRLAPCSKILKQVPARRWLAAQADPATTTVYVGIDAGEARRIPGIRHGWAPWRVEFPLTAEPALSKEAMLAEARALGLAPPHAYAEGFAHANFFWTTGRPRCCDSLSTCYVNATSDHAAGGGFESMVWRCMRLCRQCSVASADGHRTPTHPDQRHAPRGELTSSWQTSNRKESCAGLYCPKSNLKMLL